MIGVFAAPFQLLEDPTDVLAGTTLDWTTAFGVNQGGRAVGTFQTVGGAQRACFWDEDFALQVLFPRRVEAGLTLSSAVGINTAGDIVGRLERKGDPRSVAYLLPAGASDFEPLTHPDLVAGNSLASAISDNRSIVGRIVYLNEHTTVDNQSLPAGIYGYILPGPDPLSAAPLITKRLEGIGLREYWGINNSSTVTVFSSPASGASPIDGGSGSLRVSSEEEIGIGVFDAEGHPGVRPSVAMPRQINNRGVVVGLCNFIPRPTIDSDGFHGFIWNQRSGTAELMDARISPRHRVLSTRFHGINGLGEIAGACTFQLIVPPLPDPPPAPDPQLARIKRGFRFKREIVVGGGA